jgi:16S rRNA (guanine966-N2)-methyltransferase
MIRTVPGPGDTVAGVRVISGTARGRRLVAPEGSGTRPTPDRVREATFNALGSLGAVDEAAVLDLFAGSGAMGIEALSRGAARATFVDSDLAARRAIEANLAACGLTAASEVVASPVERFLAGAQQRRWDLALLDPPYDFDGWPELLLDLPAQTAVLESSRAVDPPFGWEVVRSKRYGRTHVVIATRIVV